MEFSIFKGIDHFAEPLSSSQVKAATTHRNGPVQDVISKSHPELATTLRNFPSKHPSNGERPSLIRQKPHCKMGESRFCNNSIVQTNETMSPEKLKLLQRLFPNGIKNSNFSQGNVGDCVFLASLKSTIHNNPSEIEKIISPGRRPSEIVVSFNGRKPITLDAQNFKKMGVKGDAGIQILERAYGETRKTVKGQSTRKRLFGLKAKSTLPSLNFGKETHSIIAPSQKVNTPWPGLWNFIKCKDVQFEQGIFTDAQRLEAEGLLSDISKDPADRIAIAYPRSGDSKYCSTPVTSGILRNHAYSIINVDASKKVVTLSNPHNSVQHWEASYNQFFSDFSNLNVTRNTKQ